MSTSIHLHAVVAHIPRSDRAEICGLVRSRQPHRSPTPLGLSARVCRNYHTLRSQASSEHARASSNPSQNEIPFPLAKLVRALELLSLTTSIGLQTYAVVMTSRQDAVNTEMYEDAPYHAESASPPIQQPDTSPTWLSHFAIGALILAYIFGLIHKLFCNGR